MELFGWVVVGGELIYLTDALIVGIVLLAVVGAWSLMRGYVPWEKQGER